MKPANNKAALSTAIALILIHFAVSIVHGSAHQGASVILDTFGYAYVLIVITAAPLVSGILLFTRRRKFAALLLALSMFGSFVFGVWYHFLSATNDHVSQVHGPWQETFLWTAIALALIELAGMLSGLQLYRRSES